MNIQWFSFAEKWVVVYAQHRIWLSGVAEIEIEQGRREKNYHSSSVLPFVVWGQCLFPWIMILLHPLVVLCCVRALSGGDLIRQSKDKQRHADKHCHIIHLPNILSTIVLIIHISHDSSILSTAFHIFWHFLIIDKTSSSTTTLDIP